MKNTYFAKRLFVVLVTFVISGLLAASSFAADPRELDFSTGKVPGDTATHWLPQKVTVKQGEKVFFVVKHESGGKYNFHSFAIPALHIEKRIDAGKTTRIPEKGYFTISLKPGTYDVECSYHKPAHVPAKLIVEARDAKATSPATSPAPAPSGN